MDVKLVLLFEHQLHIHARAPAPCAPGRRSTRPPPRRPGPEPQRIPPPECGPHPRHGRGGRWS